MNGSNQSLIQGAFWMLKIFTTQLTGLFKKMSEQEEFAFEDGARLLAQASLGEGKILIHGFNEMEAIVFEALHGAEPLPKADRLFINGQLTEIDETDRILLITRFSSDKEAIALAKQLREQGHWLVAISAVTETSSPSLVDYVDVHIDTKLTKPLIPDEDGSRFGFPSVMMALFAYHGLVLTMKEILSEY
jgi:phosphopantothenoylcysteine synthetase/decarboxylase